MKNETNNNWETKVDPTNPWQVGGLYFIRTVTYSVTGRLVVVGPQELVLTDAAWIGDTKRYSDSVAKADFAEVEPYPAGAPLIVGRAAVIDAIQIPVLPRTQV